MTAANKTETIRTRHKCGHNALP